MDKPDAFSMDALIAQLASMGSTIKGKSCTCPVHEDKTPSASLISDGTGHCRVFCHTCDKAWDVYDLRAHASGRAVGDVLKESKPGPMRAPVQDDRPLILADKAAVVEYTKRSGTPVKWYTYGPKESPALIVCRIEREGKKTFRQFTPTNGGYAAKNLNEKGTLPLYRQAEIADAKVVLVVEGEKACDAAWSIGVPATTACMGAGKWDWSDWKALAGKCAVLWADNDEVGVKHMATLAEHLTQLGCMVQIIDHVGIGLGVGGDIADLVEKMDATPAADIAEMVRTLMADSDQTGAVAELDRWHRQVYDGKWSNLDWPLENVGRLARATMPGCLTLVCADPGAGKSWLMLQLMRYWNNTGSRAIVRMLEDDAKAHMARMLAHVTGNGKHTDDKWVRVNRPTVEAEKAACREELARLGALIVPEGRGIWEHKDMIEWIERHAKGGARVIVIDPITGVKAGREPWLEDFTSAMKIKDLAYRYECSVIIATHPRGTAREPSLASMAGGVAWSRFAHTVLWITGTHEPEDMELHTGDVVRANRVVHILKSRHGKGSGCRFALNWTESCRFEEVGLLGAPRKTRQRTPQPIQRAGPDRAAKLRSQPSSREDLFNKDEDTP
jgi:hypothetical protein